MRARPVLLLWGLLLSISAMVVKAEDPAEKTNTTPELDWTLIHGKLVKTRKTSPEAAVISQGNVQGSANTMIHSPKAAKSTDKKLDYKIIWVYENGELVKKKIPILPSVVVKRDSLLDTPIEPDLRTKKVFFETPTILDDHVVQDDYTGKLNELKLKSKSKKK